MQIRHAKLGDETGEAGSRASPSSIPASRPPSPAASTSRSSTAGVGERLIEAIRALAKERGDTRVLWTTGEDNAGGQRFYDRLGMRREKKVYYVMDV
jgi:hypothetical protein